MQWQIWGGEGGAPKRIKPYLRLVMSKINHRQRKLKVLKCSSITGNLLDRQTYFEFYLFYQNNFFTIKQRTFLRIGPYKKPNFRKMQIVRFFICTVVYLYMYITFALYVLLQKHQSKGKPLRGFDPEVFRNVIYLIGQINSR